MNEHLPSPHQPSQHPLPKQYAQQQQVVVHRPMVSSTHLVVAWLFTVFSIGYFLPWAVAATRQKSNAAVIGLVNFLLGWTVVGWVVALIMAAMAEPRPVTVHTQVNALHVAPTAAPPGWYPQPDGTQRYWNGQAWH